MKNLIKTLLAATVLAMSAAVASAAPAFDASAEGTSIAADVPTYAGYGLPVFAAMIGLSVGLVAVRKTAR